MSSQAPLKVNLADIEPDEPQGSARQRILSRAAEYGLNVSSAKRTPQRNRAVGGAPNSAHLTTNNRSAYDFTGSPSAIAKLAKEAGRDEGVAESFYDPAGGWKKGKSIGAIGKHKDHGHIAFDEPDNDLRVSLDDIEPDESPSSAASMFAELQTNAHTEEATPFVAREYPEDLLKHLAPKETVNIWGDYLPYVSGVEAEKPQLAAHAEGEEGLYKLWYDARHEGRTADALELGRNYEQLFPTGKNWKTIYDENKRLTQQDEKTTKAKGGGINVPTDYVQQARQQGVGDDEILAGVREALTERLGLSKEQVAAMEQKYGKHPLGQLLNEQTGQPLSVDDILSTAKDGLFPFRIRPELLAALEKEKQAGAPSKEGLQAFAANAGRSLASLPAVLPRYAAMITTALGSDPKDGLSGDLLKVGDAIQDSLQPEYLREKAADTADTWSGRFGSAAGSVVNSVAGGGVLGTSKTFSNLSKFLPDKGIMSRFSPSAAAIGALQGGTQAFDEAVKAGATKEQALVNGFMNTLIGLSEGIGIEGIADNIALKRFAAQKAKAALVSGGENFGQEFFQGTATDLVKELTYDPNTKTFSLENLKENLKSGVIGGLLGVGGGAVGSAVQGTKGDVSTAQTPQTEMIPDEQATSATQPPIAPPVSAPVQDANAAKDVLPSIQAPPVVEAQGKPSVSKADHDAALEAYKGSRKKPLVVPMDEIAPIDGDASNEIQKLESDWDAAFERGDKGEVRRIQGLIDKAKAAEAKETELNRNSPVIPRDEAAEAKLLGIEEGGGVIKEDTQPPRDHVGESMRAQGIPTFNEEARVPETKAQPAEPAKAPTTVKDAAIDEDFESWGAQNLGVEGKKEYSKSADALANQNLDAAMKRIEKEGVTDENRRRIEDIGLYELGLDNSHVQRIINAAQSVHQESLARSPESRESREATAEPAIPANQASQRQGDVEPQIVAEARARNTQRLKGEQLSSSPVDALIDTAITTGYDIYKTSKDFAAWSVEMTRQLGEKVKPILEDLYARMEFDHATKTPEFKKWFGESKVVGENGDPLVVYHGTDKSFESFSLDKRGEGNRKLGIFFVDEPGFAEMFGDSTVPAYVKIENPFEISSQKWDAIREAHAKDSQYFEDWRNQLIEKGHDGIKIKGGISEFAGRKIQDPNIIAAFDPAQVKSVFNKGAFKPDSASLTDGYPEWHGKAKAKLEGGYGESNRLISKDQAKVELAAYKENQKTKRGSGGLDVEDLAHLSKIAAYHIEAGGREFADFSRRMIEQLGEYADEVKPYLQQLFDDYHKEREPHYLKQPRDPSTQQWVKAEETTGIKNAVVEAEREAQNLSPVMKEARKASGTTLDAGKQIVDTDPNFRDTVTRWAKTPKNLTDDEVGALIYDRAKLHQEHRATMEQVVKANDAGDTLAEATAREALERIEKQRDDNDKAVTHGGTQAARALSFRRFLIKEDFSLATLVQRAKVEHQGRDISQQTRAKLEKHAAEIEALQKKLDERGDRIAELEIERATKRYGEEVRREGRRTKRATTKQELDTEYADLSKQFFTAASKLSANPLTDPALYSLIGKIVKNRVKAGFNTSSTLVDEVYNTIKDQVKGVTKRDVRDAISGYGMSVKTKSQLESETSKIKRELRKLSKDENKNPATEAAKAEASKQKAQKTRLTNRLAELDGMLASKSYYTNPDGSPSMTKPRNPIALDSDALRIQRDINIKKGLIEQDFRKMKRESIFDTITHTRQSAMLANVVGITQDIVNTTAHNITATLNMVPEAILDAAQSLRTKQRTDVLKGTKPFRSVGAGLKKAASESKLVFKTGVTERMAQEQEIPHESYTGENKAAKIFDASRNYVSRIRTIADLPNFEVAMEVERRNASRSMAETERLQGKIQKGDVEARANDIYNDMSLSDQADVVLDAATAVAKQEASNEARFRTFKHDNPFSKFIQKINSPDIHPAFRATARLILPFEKAMSNYVKAGFDMSGAGVATGLTRALLNIARGNRQALFGKDRHVIASDETIRTRQKAANRAFGRGITGGAGGLLLGYTLAGLGVIGDPKDKENKEKGRVTSLHIGNQSFDLSWLGPVALPLAMGAGYYHDQSGGAVKAFGKGITQAPVMRGGKELYNYSRLSESKDIPQAVGTIGGRLASSFIPGFIKDAARLTDLGVNRDSKGFVPQIQQNIPFWRKKLPVRTSGKSSSGIGSKTYSGGLSK